MKTLFSQDELVAFTQLLVFIAKADGVITKDEELFLNNFSIQTGFGWKNLKEEGLDIILNNFKEFGSKVAVIQELVKLAMIDGEYSQPEREGIVKIANSLSITDEETTKIESWVKRGIEWVLEGQQLRNR